MLKLLLDVAERPTSDRLSIRRGIAAQHPSCADLARQHSVSTLQAHRGIANACTQTGAGEYARQGWLHDDGQARQGAWNGRTRGWLQCRPALRQTRNAARLRSGLSEELACTAASREHATSRLPGESKVLAK